MVLVYGKELVSGSLELKVHRSVIATIVDPLSQTLLSQHHMVRGFLEAFFLSRPPRRIVKFIWSVAAVLYILREWCHVRDLSRPKFSLRAMLLAWRVIVLALGMKQDRPGHISPAVVISRQCSPALCPITNMEEYLRKP